MKYWLMKSEPSEFSIDDLKQRKRERWDGIRNYQVRNMLRDEMKKGDLALFYYSNAGKETGAVGVMKIVREAYPDPTQFDPTSDYFDAKANVDSPRWLCVDVEFVDRFTRPVLLPELKLVRQLADSPLLRKGNRLSIFQLSRNQFETVVAQVS
jgi:predicted RNA-binding protein with PUA-like domain